MRAPMIYPWVRFQLISPLTGDEYDRWLREIFTEFMLGADPENAKQIMMLERGLRGCNQGEGGIAFFKVAGHDVGQWKVHMYDDGRWRGFLIGAHFDQTHKIPDLKILADAFEQFLRLKMIPYERHHRS